MRLSMPPPSRFKRAISSGRLDYDPNGRKILSFRDNEILEIPSNPIIEDVASDDDKNNIEMIEDKNLEPVDFDIPQMKEMDLALIPERGVVDPEELMIESFVIPEAEGFSLDFIQKNRTNDKIRRNYMSKLTYQKVWLSPM
jgi:hypothetical protein